IENINCDDINSANRIGIPNQDQRDLFAKLRQCPNVIPKPIQALEKLIMKNNDNPEWVGLSCEEILEQIDCENCPPLIILPPKLEICTLSDDVRNLMTLFIKNYVPKAGEENVAGKLSPAQVDLLYQHINACNAVIEFLNTGIIRQPIILPPPPVSPPPSDNNTPPTTEEPSSTPEPTTAPTPTRTPVVPVVPPITTVVDTRVVIQPLEPPPLAQDEAQPELLL
ncbi:MAG: hypothetical protein CUN52_14890, partial [Phototrophicales bacterium]